MKALNTKTGETLNYRQTDDARQAVRYAFLSKHPANQGAMHTEFLRVEPRGSIGWAFGDWFAFSVPDPVQTLFRWAHKEKQASFSAFLTVIADRRQRRKARQSYLIRKKLRRRVALDSVLLFSRGLIPANFGLIKAR